MKLEAAIFDLDGTLLDSMPIWQAWEKNICFRKSCSRLLDCMMR